MLHLSTRSTMNSLFLFVLFCSLIAATYSAVHYERQRAIPGYKNLCYDKDDGTFYKKGEEMKWKLKGCGRKICRGSSGNELVYAETHTCGKVQVPTECHVEVNLDAAYPKCCERLICPDVPDLERNAT